MGVTDRQDVGRTVPIAIEDAAPATGGEIAKRSVQSLEGEVRISDTQGWLDPLAVPSLVAAARRKDRADQHQRQNVPLATYHV